MRAENLALREEVDQASMFEAIVGTSVSLRAVLARVSRVAPTDSTVLITGETGTGKELVARAIHKGSARSGASLRRRQLCCHPAALIASELFGHEKGAFTGALERRLGRFELADAGPSSSTRWAIFRPTRSSPCCASSRSESSSVSGGTGRSGSMYG